MNTNRMLYRSLFLVVVSAYCLGTACGPQSDLAANRNVLEAGKPVAATALSAHYVRVDFDGAVPERAGEPTEYQIVSSSGEPLPVSSATIGSDNRTVYLTTDRQSLVDYTLRANEPAAGGGGSVEAAATIPNATIVFGGRDEEEPFLERAIALSSQEILLTFSRSMDAAGLNTLDHYEIVPALAPGAAVVSPDGLSVRLRLRDQEFMDQVPYTARVKNSFAPSGPFLIDPTRDRDAFDGIAAVDTAGPNVDSVESQGASTIVVTFNEPISATAVLPQNFVIDPTLTVVRAESRSFGTQVALTTQTQQAGTTYTVSVSPEMKDLAGNRVVGAQGDFTFLGQLIGGAPDDLPRVVGAVSTSNLSVVVAFSKVMGEGIDNPLYYEISGSDTAYLRVMEAIPNADQTWVELVTLGQAPDEYTVHVVNVRDSAGNPLAPPDGLLPPPLGFDPSRATFRGTPPIINPEAKLYAVDDSTDSLVVIDPATGAGTAVGSLGVSGVRSLAFDRNTDTLYGTTIPLRQLVRIDIDTGAATVVGSLGEFDIQGLAFDSNTDTLYGTTVAPRQLVRIDTRTGAVTVAKSLGGNTVWTLAFDPNTDTLYGGNDSGLMTLSTATGAVTERGALAFNTIQGLAYNPGFRTLYGVDRVSGQLLRIDRFTGESTAIGPIGFDQVHGLAVGPILLNEQIDSDGDGFADWFEELGWFITVHFDDGTISTAHVTSDPFSKDTDGDGIWDGDENRHNFDPRTDDTDADQVDDYSEWNIYYSDPRKQDTDGDGISDLFEINLFKTSPILADTDGDQIPDNVELFERNRNPRVADIPIPQIEVGEISLKLDERYEWTDETGTTDSTERSATTTLSQGTERSFASSDVSSSEAVNSFNQSSTAEFEIGGLKVFGNWKLGFEVGFEQTRSRGYSFQVDQSSAQSSTQEAQNSLTEASEISHNSTMTRTVEDADLLATVTVKNAGDIAFSISDLELTVLLNDPRSGSRVPVATLVPQRTFLTGEGLSLNLGPFDSERGPFIFNDVQIFPEEVSNLRKAPSALVVKLANFNIESEDGRNFAFSSQETNDQTAGLVIDYGNGNVETYRVATASTFDEVTGKPMGISMRTALEDILGIAQADDVLPWPGLADGNADLTDPALHDTYGTVVGTFSTDPTDQDAPTYAVEVLTRVRAVQNGDPNVIDPGSDNIPDKKYWALIASPSDLPTPGTNFSDTRLFGGSNYTLKYVEDFDKDRLFAYEEWEAKSSDLQEYTDDDDLSDYFEVKTGWSVGIGEPYKTKSYPFTDDSDNDEVLDHDEFLELTDPLKADTDEDGISDWHELYGYDIRLPDTDSNPNNNPILEVRPYANTPQSDVCQVIVPTPEDPLAAAECAHHRRNFATDPLSRDTDSDGVPDGKEFFLGSNPNIRDADTVRDSDSDGLSDREETDGWDVVVTDIDGATRTIQACKTTANQPPCIDSDPDDPDTDGDGVPDLLEKILGLNPKYIDDANDGSDTDSDDLTDHKELNPANYADKFAEYLSRCQLTFDPEVCLAFVPDGDPVGTDPWDADTDDDLLDDGFEDGALEAHAWYVTGKFNEFVGSDPLDDDQDGDGLLDGEEWEGVDGIGHGLPGDDPDGDATHPNNRDSDGDCDPPVVTPNCWDSEERAEGRDPLIADMNVTVILDSLTFDRIDCGFEDVNRHDYMELIDGNFYTRGPHDADKQTLYAHACLPDRVDCEIERHCLGAGNNCDPIPDYACEYRIGPFTTVTTDVVFFPNDVATAEKTYLLKANESIEFTSDVIKEGDQPNFCPTDGDPFGAIEPVILTYPVTEVSGEPIEVSSTCTVTVRYSLEIN